MRLHRHSGARHIQTHARTFKRSGGRDERDMHGQVLTEKKIKILKLDRQERR